MTRFQLVALIFVFIAPLLLVLIYFCGGPTGKWVKSQWQRPHWFVREVVFTLLVGLAVMTIQKDIDDTRGERDNAIAAQQNERDHQIAAQQNERDHQIAAQQDVNNQRLENTRFVRDRASWEPQVRPFASFDLTGMDLVGLGLAGADLSLANLTDAHLNRVNLGAVDPAQLPPNSLPLNGLSNSSVLMGANLCRAELRSANLKGALLIEANFAEVDLRLTDLAGAVLYGADLSRAKLPPHDSPFLNGVLYDPSTEWPAGYQLPPPSDPMRRLAFGIIEILVGDFATPNCADS